MHGKRLMIVVNVFVIYTTRLQYRRKKSETLRVLIYFFFSFFLGNSFYSVKLGIIIRFSLSRCGGKHVPVTGTPGTTAFGRQPGRIAFMSNSERILWTVILRDSGGGANERVRATWRKRENSIRIEASE